MIAVILYPILRCLRHSEAEIAKMTERKRAWPSGANCPILEFRLLIFFDSTYKKWLVTKFIDLYKNLQINVPNWLDYVSVGPDLLLVRGNPVRWWWEALRFFFTYAQATPGIWPYWSGHMSILVRPSLFSGAQAAMPPNVYKRGRKLPDIVWTLNQTGEKSAKIRLRLAMYALFYILSWNCMSKAPPCQKYHLI